MGHEEALRSMFELYGRTARSAQRLDAARLERISPRLLDRRIDDVLPADANPGLESAGPVRAAWMRAKAADETVRQFFDRVMLRRDFFLHHFFRFHTRMEREPIGCEAGSVDLRAILGELDLASTVLETLGRIPGSGQGPRFDN